MLLQEEFLRELHFVRCYSSHTISAYKRDLSYYQKFRKTKKSIQNIYAFLNKHNLSARSQVRIISCIRTYLKFLQFRGYRSTDIKHLKLPSIKAKLPKPIRLEEFKKLYIHCKGKQEYLSIRNQLILSFLYGLGCRVSELVSMNIQDFNETESWISVIGKGDRQRLLPIPKDLYKFLKHYLSKSRPHFCLKNQASLFLNIKGNRPSRIDIWRWLKGWSIKAGFHDIKSPHTFRHGCATSLLDQGADLVSIQKLLGHLNIQTTQIYTSVSFKNLKKSIDQFHPLSDNKLKKFNL